MSDAGNGEVTAGTALLAEQIRLVYRMPFAMAANLFNAPIVAAVLWRSFPAWPLLLWLALFGIVVPLRLWLWWRYRQTQPAPAAAGPWGRRYAIGAFATGCLWGALSLAVLAAPDAVDRVFIAFVIGGMCAGAVPSLAPYPRALNAFIWPASVPVALAFFAGGGLISAAMGIMALVFTGAMMLVGRGFGRALAESVRLQLENAELIRGLTAARDAAEAASLAKSSFLSQMSHELRTPLNAIIGFSDMFANEMFGKLPSAEYITYSRYMSESAQHLLEMIRHILELSRAEAGATRLEESEVALAPLIDLCLHMVSDRARAAGLAIDRSLPDDLPALRADAGKVRQVLINLLSNAVKFTPSGGRIGVSAATDEAGGVLITVADSGIGMRQEDIPKALMPFVQLDDTFTRRYEGIGLGLPLSREFMEMHGGTLSLVSAPGQGTTAAMRFPPQRSLPRKRRPPGGAATG